MGTFSKAISTFVRPLMQDEYRIHLRSRKVYRGKMLWICCSHEERQYEVKEISRSPLGYLIACSIVFFFAVVLSPFAKGQTVAQGAQTLNIGCNGPNRQLPYMTVFYAATNNY